MFLKKILGNVRFVHWTDSECSLKLLKNTGARYPVYYTNRLSKIHAASSPDDWHHVDSANNPADFCSRGIWAEEAAKWSTFHRGSAFLGRPESEWPPIKDYLKSPDFLGVKVMGSQTRPPPPPPPPDAVYEQGRMAAKKPGASTLILSPTKKRVRQIS